jgi:hypothetical protein
VGPIFDRGYARGPWLGALRGFDSRFIVRWKLNDPLVTQAGGKLAAWKIPRGKVGLAPRTMWHAVHHGNVQGRVLFFPIAHPDFPDWPVTLLGGRRKGANPWYLGTNEPVESAEDAWKGVRAYARRWRVEVLVRHLKRELAIQSLRVSRWEDRLKRLRLVRLASAFLRQMMAQDKKKAGQGLMASACRRTGPHLRAVERPLSRLRLALSRLWLASACWFVRPERLNL